MNTFSFAEKLHPFLKDADRALAENARLLEMVAQLQHELRYSQEMQDRAAERIDLLEHEKEQAITEAAALKARMRIFGDATNAIFGDIVREPAREQKVRVHQSMASPKRVDVTESPAIDFLRSIGS